MTDPQAKPCPFCPPREREILETHPLAVAVRDSNPLTRGHASRYKGDADDPRAVVRWIFPRKADYRSK